MKSLFLAGLLCAAAASSASAKSLMPETAWEFGLHPGAAIPAGAYRRLAMSALVVEGSVGYKALDWFVVGLEGGYIFGHKLRGTTRAPIRIDLDADGTPDTLSFQSNVRDAIFFGGPMMKLGPWITLGAETKWKPYFVGGVGVYNERMGSGTIHITGGRTSNGTTVLPQDIAVRRTSESYFGADAGLGFEFKIDENGGIGAEARYRRFFKPGGDYQALVPSLRLLYYF